MRRLLVWLPFVITACSGNGMGPEALGGPLGRFGHSLTREPAFESAAPATPPAEIASLSTTTPTPRTLVATPFQATPAPTPWPTPSPPPPTPSPTPPVVVLLTPDPTPTPVLGLGTVTVNRRSLVVWVRDDAAEDGDRIQIDLNDKILPGAFDLRLTNAWIPLNVELRSGVNRLRWTALNEGDVSPNTFEIYVAPEVLVAGSANQRSTYLLTGDSEILTVNAP